MRACLEQGNELETSEEALQPVSPVLAFGLRHSWASGQFSKFWLFFPAGEKQGAEGRSPTLVPHQILVSLSLKEEIGQIICWGFLAPGVCL